MSSVLSNRGSPGQTETVCFTLSLAHHLGPCVRMRFSSLLLLPALLCNHSVNAVVSVRAVQPDSLQSKGAVSRRPYRRLYDNASVENTEFLPESINTTVPLRNFQLAVPPVRSTRKSQKCTIELVHHVRSDFLTQSASLNYSLYGYRTSPTHGVSRPSCIIARLRRTNAGISQTGVTSC